MVFLQAAMASGMVLYAIVLILIFVGIPLFTSIFMGILGKRISKEKTADTSRKKKLELIGISLIFSITAISIIFFNIIFLMHNMIDWSST